MVQIHENAHAGPSGSKLTLTNNTIPSNEINAMDIDLASSQLIFRLTLENIRELEEGRKGKARHDTPQTDSEYALDIQAELTRVALQVANDAALAASMGEALMTDRECLIAIAKSEQAAVDDRRAAVALSKGEKLPEISKWVEDQRKEEEKASKSLPSSPSSSFTDLEEIEESLLEFEELPAYEVLCNGCHDYFSNEEKYIKLPCEHTFCSACIISLVKTCTLDETLFPLNCCNKPIDITTITPYLNTDLQRLFAAKCIEFGTPTASRLYCPNTKCSAFIPSHSSVGSSTNKPSSASAPIPAVPCPKCDALACPGCKQPAHPGDNCAENVLTLQVRQLAKKEMWQTCPGCKAIVELRQGCYHIVCRCKTQFCYLCGAAWKTCRCEYAAENRLYERS